MANACLEEVLLYGPLHEVVVDGGFGNTFVVGDRFEVVALQRSNVCKLQVKLVGKS